MRYSKKTLDHRERHTLEVIHFDMPSLPGQPSTGQPSLHGFAVYGRVEPEPYPKPMLEKEPNDTFIGEAWIECVRLLRHALRALDDIAKNSTDPSAVTKANAALERCLPTHIANRTAHPKTYPGEGHPSPNT
jgi:hypothetical protein